MCLQEKQLKRKTKLMKNHIANLLLFRLRIIHQTLGQCLRWWWAVGITLRAVGPAQFPRVVTSFTWGHTAVASAIVVCTNKFTTKYQVYIALI